MSDRAEFALWCVVRQMPNLQNAIVVRCERRSLAEEQLRMLRQIHPEAFYELVFDPMELSRE